MPTPMMPHVPTSMRLRGLYMSTIESVKSSTLAPSFTKMASGLALMMSFTTASALWKFIGVGFLASVSAILATLPFFFSATAFSHSAGGFDPVPISLQHRATARADIADHRRVDAHIGIGFLRRDVHLDEFLATPILRALAA